MNRPRSRRPTFEPLESRALRANLSVYALSWDRHSTVGDDVNYYIAITGRGKFEDVTVDVVLPDNMEYHHAWDDRGKIHPVHSGDHLIFARGTFEPRGDNVYIHAIPRAPGTSTARMVVSTSTPETTTADNTAEFTVVTAAAGLPETTVVSLERGAKQLRLTFGAALDPDSARHSISYGLIRRSRGASRPIRVASIVYDPETWTVTLSTRQKLPAQYLLSVTGLLDANGKEVPAYVYGA